MRISVNSGAHSMRRTGERFPMAQSIDALADAGFGVVDINFFATNKTGYKHEIILDGEDWRANIAAIGERAAARSVEIPTSHLPCFDFTNPDLPERAWHMQLLDRSIEASAMLGAKWAVIHPFGETAAAVEALTPIVARAAQFDLHLVIENKVGYSLDTQLDTVDAFNGAVGVCLDIGHAHIDGIDTAETVARIGDRLKVLHIHDNYGKKDTHDIPFSGTIDWPAFMAALRAVNYSGDFNFEVNSATRPDSARPAYLRYLYAIGEALCAMYGNAVI